MSYKKFTKDIGILAATQVVTALSGLFTIPIITKTLGAESFGIWTQLIVTLGLIAPLALVGLPYTLVRFLAGERDEGRIRDGIWSVFAIITGTTILIGLMLIIFAGNIATFFHCDTVFIFVLAFLIIIECLNQLFLNIFRAFQEIKKYSLFSIFQNIAEAGLIVIVVSSGHGLLGAILSVLAIRTMVFLAMGSFIIKKVGITIPKFLQIKEYLAFGLPNILGDVSFWIIQSSDRYVIGFFLGTLFVGYYAPAYTLGGCIGFLITPMTLILPATLAKHYDQGEIDEVKQYLKNSLKYFLTIAIPSVFGISVLSKELLKIFTTPQISDHAYYVVPFVALSMLLCGVYIIVDQIISLKKKTHINGMIYLVAAALNITLNLLLIPRVGILGAAATTLLGYAMILVLTSLYAYKKIAFGIDWLTILKSVGASTLMAFLVFYMHPVGLVKAVATVMVGAAAYFAMMFFVKGFDKKEILFLKELLKKDLA